MVVGAVTTPSGVYFERNIPYADWVKAPVNQFDLYLLPPSDNIETELSSGNAIAASYIEDLDPSGLIHGFIQFVLQVPTTSPDQIGPFQTSVDVPIEAVAAANLGGGGIIYAPYNEALAALQATAAR
jgi:hypothetical protein